MNIRDLKNSVNSPDRSRTSSVSGAGKVTGGSTARSNPDLQQKGVQDSVEISDAARAAANQQQARAEEVELARKALLGIPPLSQDRVEDILKRVQEGYYSPPEMLKQITEKTAERLFGQDTEP